MVTPRDSAPSNGSFPDRMDEAIRRKGSCLVVGLDPVVERLPPEAFQRLGAVTSGGQGVTAKASAAFGLFLTEVIDAVADVAVAVKPNTAFFERYGACGFDCLRQVAKTAQDAGLLVIADAKRGDVSHTAEAYAEALLGEIPDTLGPFVDAVTVSPYLGSDSVAPYLDYARRGKGVFVLVRTSNPSGGELQELSCEGRPVYLHVAEQAARWGESLVGESGLSAVGAVVGATRADQAREIRACMPQAIFLVPGLGAQGAKAEDLAPCFTADGRGAVVNASRSIVYAFDGAGSKGNWKDSVRKAASEARDSLELVRSSRAG